MNIEQARQAADEACGHWRRCVRWAEKAPSIDAHHYALAIEREARTAFMAALSALKRLEAQEVTA